MHTTLAWFQQAHGFTYPTAGIDRFEENYVVLKEDPNDNPN